MKRRLSKQMSEDFLKNIKTLKSQTDEDWTAESNENLKRISMYEKDIDLEYEGFILLSPHFDFRHRTESQNFYG